MRAKKGQLIICLALLLLLFSVSPVSAQSFRNLDPASRNGPHYWGALISPADGKYHKYHFTVTLKDLASCTFNSTEMNLISNNFTAWAFQNSTQQLPGRFDIVRYDAGFCISALESPTNVGNWDDDIIHFFQIDYNNSGTPPAPPVLPAGYSLVWIQFVYVNYRDGAGNPVPSPHLDPCRNNFEDELPFYFSSAEMSLNRYFGQDIYNRAPLVNMSFYDAPAYPLRWAVMHNINPVSFEAHLYAAAWNNSDPGTVIVYYSGVRWGYEIAWHDEGEVYPASTVPFTCGGVAGNEKLIENEAGPRLNGTMAVAVGGINLPIDRFGILAPCIASALLVIAATTTAAVYFKYASRIGK